MARIVQLKPGLGGTQAELLQLTHNGYCIALLTDDDVLSAEEIVSKFGCQVVMDPEVGLRQPKGFVFKGLVVFASSCIEGFTGPTYRNFLRVLCNNIDARACMYLHARNDKKKRKVAPIKPWMLKLRPVDGREHRLEKATQA